MECRMKNAECRMNDGGCTMHNAQFTIGRLALTAVAAMFVSANALFADEAPKAEAKPANVAAEQPKELTPAEKRAREEAMRARLREIENEIGQLMNPSLKNNRAEGIELMRKIASDKEFPFSTRLNYVKRMLRDGAAGKNTVLWTNSLPFATEFLASETNVSAQARAELLGLFFQAHLKANMPEALDEAVEILGNPLCDGGTKTEAARDIARRALAAGGKEAAFGAIAKYAADNPAPCARAKSWILDEYFDFEGAYRTLLEAGLVLEAANYCVGGRYWRPDLAEKHYRDIVEKGPGSTPNDYNAFTKAYDYFLTRDLELAEKHFWERLGTHPNHTNWAMRAINWQIGRGEDLVFRGDFEKATKVFAFIRKACEKTNTDIYPETAVAGIYALAGVGRPAEAAAAAREMADAAHPFPDDDKNYWRWKTNDVFRMRMVSELLCAKGDAAAIEKLARETAARIGPDRSPRQRSEAANFVGTVANVANFEETVRGISAYRLSLYVPKPKKHYTVKFSKTPIDGLVAWDSAPVEAEVAHLDREYGGHMDFLQTDVATGDRGEGIGSAKDEKKLPPPEMRILADRNGIHFRYDIFEPEPERFVVGEINAGSFETYIAPGDNEPYTCIMYSVQSDGCSLFSTMYDAPGHRRMNKDDRAGVKFQHRIMKDRVQAYCFFSWANWMERVPKKGTEWDYEPLYWNRHGSFAWNGTESIHGRSTWGRLVFDLDDADRAAIYRPLLVKARSHFKDARKRVAGQVGIFERWDDPVLGDHEFFEACVRPIEERLKPYCDKINSKTTDEEVLALADEVLSDWWNVEYLVERARVEWSMSRK